MRARSVRDEPVRIVEQPLDRLAELAAVPIAFEVRSRFEIREGGAGREFTLIEWMVDPPYVKDYDVTASGGPDTWGARFDLARWGLLAAVRAGRWVGGAVVAAQAAEVDLLEGRSDLALLWDIRVAPQDRGRGTGTALLDAAAAWATSRGCSELKVETQDINVPACRFYARSGFELRAIDHAAYPGLDEVRMLWYRAIA